MQTPKCAGNSTLYTGYDEEKPPTRQQAAALCSGCPLMQQCNQIAMRLKPTYGVWAGKVWVPYSHSKGKPRD